ncbi:DNA polymerase III subunit delta' [Rahnella variigena]|jgi:DNA polymerase-3 subunit delta'|uniref:DNA polymerase III subunit delta' n=1 Tax=Rahnella variigena TaxID=574964 RepID=A0ABX9PUU2_9GAMM|nr:DNA polymerase III subunit delta' [Rahnella variigena]RJT56493.1 DNA polymerase III subunit delta' [Rahnella variigena]RKF68831.1 DNA polymerase III subunit delta' [Rahnella variigena]
MNWYPWLSAPYRQLTGQYLTGRGHHAVLMHAAAGIGDEALVYGLSRWLLCQHKDGEKSCGSCHSCQLMIAGNHPDWHILQPEKGKNSLGIDPVRQLIETLYNYSQQGGSKVVWIPQTELLTEAAANALLKTLEEPPAGTYFLLGCREPSALLATIRSRCFYWHLPVPEEALAVQWINRQLSADPVSIKTALRLTNGAPLSAIELLQPERWKQRVALCQQLYTQCQQQDMLSLLPQLNHDDAPERLYWLATLLLDAIKWQQQAGQFIINHDQQPLIALLAGAQSSVALQQSVSAWMHCRHQLLSIVGVNRELLLTEQLLEWEQMLQGTVSASIFSSALSR